MTAKSITLAELDARIRRGDGTVVLDVRSAEEFAEGHVTGAVHVPAVDLLRAAIDFDPSVRFVTVCTKGGGRSQAAAGALVKIGRDAVYLEGGTLSWLHDKQPS